jgi:hypothetical protein
MGWCCTSRGYDRQLACMLSQPGCGAVAMHNTSVRLGSNGQPTRSCLMCTLNGGGDSSGGWRGTSPHLFPRACQEVSHRAPWTQEPSDGSARGRLRQWIACPLAPQLFQLCLTGQHAPAFRLGRDQFLEANQLFVRIPLGRKELRGSRRLKAGKALTLMYRWRDFTLLHPIRWAIAGAPQ